MDKNDEYHYCTYAAVAGILFLQKLWGLIRKGQWFVWGSDLREELENWK